MMLWKNPDKLFGQCKIYIDRDRDRDNLLVLFLWRTLSQRVNIFGIMGSVVSITDTQLHLTHHQALNRV